MDLVSWMQLASLSTGHDAGLWDLKRCPYRPFTSAGKIIISSRRKRLLIPQTAPESSLFCTLQDGITRLSRRWRSGDLAASNSLPRNPFETKEPAIREMESGARPAARPPPSSPKTDRAAESGKTTESAPPKSHEKSGLDLFGVRGDAQNVLSIAQIAFCARTVCAGSLSNSPMKTLPIAVARIPSAAHSQVSAEASRFSEAMKPISRVRVAL